MNVSPRLLVFASLLAGCISAALAPRERATGCAPAPPPGSIVHIASEAAIIVWDAKAKREHFIRRASFESSAPDFGFLVPTPAKPTLTEVDQSVFDDLAEVTAPRIEYVQRPMQVQPGCGCSAEGVKSTQVGSAPPNSAVRVLEEKQLAGQDVAVLEADDAESLQTWLKEHDYEFSPKLAEWVEPYLEKKWVITAFKYAKAQEGEEPSPQLNTSAVCMSFDAERPFYPYREPKADAEHAEPGQRLLRVFFIAPNKMQGELEETEQAWPGKAVHAKPLQAEHQQQVRDKLQLDILEGETGWWLTEFEDHASPRPGSADLYFSPADDVKQVERPPIIQYVLSPGFPLDLSFTMLAAGLLLCLVQAPRRTRTLSR